MSLEAVMEELKKDYIESLSTKKTDIEERFASQDIQGLREVFHKLKGTGATYGVPEISLLGGVVEKLCDKSSSDLTWVIPEIIVLLQKIQACHRQKQQFDIEAYSAFKKIRSLVQDN